MSQGLCALTKGVGLAAAALLWLTPGVWAGGGEHVRAGDAPGWRTASVSTPAPVARRVAYVVPVPMTISIEVQPPARITRETVYVNLRGPDGQVRRFPVEGGAASIQTRQVTLHPGESLSLHWTGK